MGCVISLCPTHNQAVRLSLKHQWVSAHFICYPWCFKLLEKQTTASSAMICQLEFLLLPLIPASYSSQLSLKFLNHKAWLDCPACLPQWKTFNKPPPLQNPTFCYYSMPTHAMTDTENQRQDNSLSPSKHKQAKPFQALAQRYCGWPCSWLPL